MRSVGEGGGRGRGIVRYFVGNRQREGIIGDRQEERSRKARKRQRVKMKTDNKIPGDVEIKNVEGKDSPLKKITAKTVKTKNVMNKERRKGIKKRRRQRMRKLSERIKTKNEQKKEKTKDLKIKHIERSDSSNDDVATKKVTTAITCEEASVNRFHVKNAQNDFDTVNVKTSNDTDFVKIVKNFDKESIKTVLEKKEQKVGDVLLVNGRPAVVKKRKRH